MKHLAAIVLTLAFAVPAMAQRGVLFVGAEGVKTSNKVTFDPNVVRYGPRFDSEERVGSGINWFVTARSSVAVKVAALKSRFHLRSSRSDFVDVADLGYAQIYPITVPLHWHMLHGTVILPFTGAGTGHVVLKDLDRTFGLSGVHFEDPTGLVVDSGGQISLSKRFSLYGDARYTPTETRSSVTFGGAFASARIGEKPMTVFTGITFRF
jgi:outer membrane protein W